MLLDQAVEAMSDFAKAVSLNTNFPIALVQKLYTDYRLAVSMSNASQVAAAMTAFEDTISRFPSCPECYLLYAQVSHKIVKISKEGFSKFWISSFLNSGVE